MSSFYQIHVSYTWFEKLAKFNSQRWNKCFAKSDIISYVSLMLIAANSHKLVILSLSPPDFCTPPDGQYYVIKS